MVSLCHQTQLFWAFVLDSGALPAQPVTVILGLTIAWVGACYASILSTHDRTGKSELDVQTPGPPELDLLLFPRVWLLPVGFCSRWMILVSQALKSLDPHGVLSIPSLPMSALLYPTESVPGVHVTVCCG